MLTIFNFQLALASFFEQDDGQEVPQSINLDSDEENSPMEDARSVPFLPSMQPGTPDPSAGKDTVTAKEKDKKSKANPSATGPRIATIHNINKSDEEDEEEQGQVYFLLGFIFKFNLICFLFSKKRHSIRELQGLVNRYSVHQRKIR